jgi:hypothetical protein
LTHGQRESKNLVKPENPDAPGPATAPKGIAFRRLSGTRPAKIAGFVASGRHAVSKEKSTNFV